MKNKDFDTVKLMRQIRDLMSEEMKGMTIEEQIKYIEEKSGLRRTGKKQVTSLSGKES